MARITPMIQQYLSIKNKHKDKILFFRVGDFYEMFFDDAVLVSRELDLNLTTRDTGKEDPVPLAGVPYQTAGNYIARLLDKGYKVAVCDQVEDPQLAKGIVKREITRIITPGTVTENDMLEEKQNNYLLSIYKHNGDDKFGVAAVDVSTGEFFVSELSGKEKLKNEIYRVQPAEVLSNSFSGRDGFFNELGISAGINFSEENIYQQASARKKLVQVFGSGVVRSSGINNLPLAELAAGAVIDYLLNLNHGDLAHINKLVVYKSDEYMLIDASTRRNLEIIETMPDRKKKGSLLWVIDHTLTPMGGRLLRRWLEQPLTDRKRIEERYDAVDELGKNKALREDLALLLKGVVDLERLCSRINYATVNARDMVALKNTLQKLPLVKQVLDKSSSSRLRFLGNNLPLLSELKDHIAEALVDNPPLTVKEGGIIRTGYNEEVDRLKRTSTEGKAWLVELEEKERQKTNIKSLKIGFNRVFGYYIEVTKANAHLVPSRYIRKQTLVNAERYITDELKRCEDMIIGAEEKVAALEYELFEDLRKTVGCCSPSIQQAARIIAELDCYQSLAAVAEVHNYTRPAISDRNTLLIKEGRHPVVERTLLEERFVPNDAFMDGKQNFLIITGPNMAGKSTYCRSIALIVILAQMGSFVPAREAEIPLTDRVFARIGARDDLSAGQSTFMVEMQETASILANATENSLIILDEVGRGTSTYDGISIAQAVIEYIQKNIRAKTLFSTHYHELTSLEEKTTGVKNYHAAVKERESKVIFLRKVLRGRADKSYGINVARLAGLPVEIIDRAGHILEEMERDNAGSIRLGLRDKHTRQLTFFPGDVVGDDKRSTSCVDLGDRILKEIKNLNLVETTPLEALNKLFSLQQKINGSERGK